MTITLCVGILSGDRHCCFGILYVYVFESGPTYKAHCFEASIGI